MTIEWFDPKLGTPSVSIAEYGLTFNKAAVDVMSSPSRVLLGFDHEKKLIVVKPLYNPSNEEANKSFSFAERERSGYVRIASKEFIRFIIRYFPGIEINKTIRCLARWDDKEKMLLVDLLSGITESKSSTEQ